jgi:signal transduction histidine kinase
LILASYWACAARTCCGAIRTAATSPAIWLDLIARRPFHSFSYWAETPQGRRCFTVSCKPLFDPKGRFTGYRGAGRDITGQARIEEELAEATEAAKAASKAKSEFLSTMSHELRTPLNAVISFSEVIGDELFGPTGHPRYLEYAHDIHSSGVHLLDMINDI